MPYIGSDPSNRFVAPKAASVFSGDGSTTAFTLDHAVGSDEDILVSVDGVIQEPSVAYAVSNGTTLTFTAAPSSNSGNNIFVYYLFRTVGTVSHPSNNALQASDGTFSGSLAIGTTSLVSDAKLAISSDNTESNIFLERSGSGKFDVAIANTSGSLSFKGGSNQTTVAGLTEFMKIDGANGAITKPLQPAFNVTNSSDQNNLSDNTVLTFDTEIFDQNSDFASNTFTAPVTGKYQLQLSGRFGQLDKDSDWVRVELITSNRLYLGTIIDPGVFGYDPTYWSFNFGVLADMDASDTAYLQWGQQSGSNIADKDSQINFTGYLVC